MTMQDPQLLERAADLTRKCASQAKQIVALQREVARLERMLGREPQIAVEPEPELEVAEPASDTVQIRHVPLEFIAAMEAAFEAGVKGSRVAGDWKLLSQAVMYEKLKSMLGHATKGEFVSAACNALILWWHSERK